MDTGNYKDSEKYCLLGLEIRERLLPADSGPLAICYNNLSVLYTKTKQYAKAVEYMTKSLDINRIRFGENNDKVATNLLNLATIKARMGDESFKDDIDRAIAIFETNYMKFVQVMARAYIQAAQTLSAFGMNDEVLDYYQKSYSIISADGFDENDLTVLTEFAYFYLKKKEDYSSALPLFKKAYEISDDKLGSVTATANWCLQHTYMCYFGVLNQLAKKSPEYSRIMSELASFDKGFVMTAEVIDGSTASEKGLSGEYVLCSYDDWSIETVRDTSPCQSSVPKGELHHLLLYRQGHFYASDFYEKSGLKFNYKKIDTEEKRQIIRRCREYFQH